MNNESIQAGSESAAIAPITLALSEMGKESAQWTLTLHPNHLALNELPDPQPYIIVRQEVMKSAVLMEGMRAFVLQKPKKLTFKLSEEATRQLAEWIGASRLAALYLKRRYGWILPIAVIWVLGSMPVKGNPNIGADGMPLDPIGLFLGVTLIIAWAFAKWRPHPVLFLVDSLWLLMMSAQLTYDVFNGRSQGWLVLVFFLAWMAISGFKQFRRFKGTMIERVA